MATKNSLVTDFQDLVYSYFREYGRDLEWRRVDDSGAIDPYHVLVSEIMLQQTQVPRVEKKYSEFLEEFPTLQSLAASQLSDVLRLWSGLGYNRRAKYLYDFAAQLGDKEFPTSAEELSAYKGIGTNTAAAVLVYALDQRRVFIETNIRTVYINHFFPDVEKVTDKEILEKVEQTLPEGSVREWYWALMDYGTYLKKNGLSKLSKSNTYKKQSTFKGSMRELRSSIVKTLLEHDASDVHTLEEVLEDKRVPDALKSLEKDGLIKVDKGSIRLS